MVVTMVAITLQLMPFTSHRKYVSTGTPQSQKQAKQLRMGRRLYLGFLRCLWCTLCGLRKILQGIMVEHASNGVSNFQHRHFNRTLRRIRIRTILTHLIGGLTHAGNGRERAIQRANNRAQRNLFRFFNESKPTVHTGTTRQHTRVFLLEKDRLQKSHGNVLPFRDIRSADRSLAIGLRQLQ